MKQADIPAVHKLLKREFAKGKAPVIELIQAQTRDPFKVLVATILSARTKDETTTGAAHRLFAQVGTPDALRNTPVKTVEELIFPVGFYHVKAKHLKALPDALDHHFGGVIPHTVEELCKLPGVGRKTANLVAVEGFGKFGICVDTHVHRISNRFGYVSTKVPDETEQSLRMKLPKKYWKRYNELLVIWGQNVCRPISPFCSRCDIEKYCQRADVGKSR